MLLGCCEVVVYSVEWFYDIAYVVLVVESTSSSFSLLNYFLTAFGQVH